MVGRGRFNGGGERSRTGRCSAAALLCTMGRSYAVVQFLSFICHDPLHMQPTLSTERSQRACQLLISVFSISQSLSNTFYLSPNY